MNEVDKFLNSNLIPYERFEITGKNSPKAIRKYLEGLGWDYTGSDTDTWDVWWYFYNSSIEKCLTLSIDVEEFRMYLYWSD